MGFFAASGSGQGPKRRVYFAAMERLALGWRALMNSGLGALPVGAGILSCAIGASFWSFLRVDQKTGHRLGHKQSRNQDQNRDHNSKNIMAFQTRLASPAYHDPAYYDPAYYDPACHDPARLTTTQTLPKHAARKPSLRHMRQALLAFLVLFLPGEQAFAHPHIYVETTLHITLDPQGRFRTVEVTWAYDPLYSLVVLETGGYDPDYDGVLTADELDRLQGWDMQWDPGFKGDLVLSDAEGTEIPLGPPEPIQTILRDGQIITRHLRRIAPTADVQPGQPTVQGASDGYVLRAFDPEFYTAYDLTGGVTLAGPCKVQVHQPELTEARKSAQKLMAQYDETARDAPNLGHLFAEDVRLSCPEI